MKVTCTKPQAAIRQIDIAITLLFSDYDPLAIRTLAGAAHGILADLVERQAPGGSWREKAIEGSGLSRKAALDIINGAQNYLKHAHRDPDSNLSFEEEENDHLIFFATLECGELATPLSIDMQAFQIWYLASYPATIGHEVEMVSRSRSAFPDLETLSRKSRLVRGAEFIAKLKASKLYG